VRTAGERYRHDPDYTRPGVARRVALLRAATPAHYTGDVVVVPEHLRMTPTVRNVSFAGRKRGVPTTDLVRLEMQYVLHRAIDHAGFKIRSSPYHKVLDLLGAARAESLTDDTPVGWLTRYRNGELVTALSTGDTGPDILLHFAATELAMLYDAREETEKDVWDLVRLGAPEHTHTRYLDFRQITQPWLRRLTRLWIMHRLNIGQAQSSQAENLKHVRTFTDFLGERGVIRAEDVDREKVLLPFVSHVLSHANWHPNTKSKHLVTARLFLDDIRRHGWADLPANAVLYPDERARRVASLPRSMDDLVVSQIERYVHEMPDAQVRRILTLLLETGRRISELVGCPQDCLIYDNVGEPWLRYTAFKQSKEHSIPLGEKGSRAERIILEQQAVVRERWPDAPFLFPSPVTRYNGRRAQADSTVRRMIHEWAARHNILDSNGKPVVITPHRFRHTIATRMLNNGVRLEHVQQFLGHASLEMTQVYARLHDTTMKNAWLKYQVDIRGDQVPDLVPVGGPTADERWMKTKLRNQALPNGHCGLPTQQECPHANACLTCDHFSTDTTFLPLHRAQLSEAEGLVASAQAKGHKRVAEMNGKVVVSLSNIIASLEALRSDAATG
jgi:site-specific recombinase XerD